MIVYGDPSYVTDLGSLLEGLRSRLAIARRSGAASLDVLRALLIEAGQVEQALADADEAGDCPPGALRVIEAATNHFAAAFLTCWRDRAPSGLDRDVASAGVALDALRGAVPRDASVRVKIPEGFAFYALYPEQYCHSAERWLSENAGSERAVIVGIRSIGTSLSALVMAVLSSARREVHRVTVRPDGHPFERRAELRPDALRGAKMALVVDEGPGLSGSSMVAAARALIGAGVRPDRISFLPGHDRGPGHAASAEVRAWWSSTPTYTTPLSELRWDGRSLAGALAAQTPAFSPDAGAVERTQDLSAGMWRGEVIAAPSEWPPAFAAFERTKYRCVLRSGASVLWRFAGLACGPDGRTGAEQASSLLAGRALQGLTPRPLSCAYGFVATEWVEGAPLARSDSAETVLEHIGRYVAAVAGPLLDPGEQRSALARAREILYWNTCESLGEPAAERARAWSDAAARRLTGDLVPSYGDGRLAPWEWLRTSSGELVKTDSVGHDADHTAVGFQPLSWDLAGAIVEWDLPGSAIDVVMAAMRSSGAAAPEPTLLTFHMMAYASFRLGMCAMCAAAVTERQEQARLRCAEAFYRARLERALASDPPDA